MTVISIAPSQWASATAHLERRDGWRAYRVDGVRYVALPSGTSGRVYQVRADAAGCGCPWYQRTGRQCAHMLSVELAALEAELSDATIEAVLGPAPKSRYEALFPACRDCGDLVDGYHDGRCRRCGEDAEWQARRDARAS